ncbi:MAG: polysaccharide pyruvyl transferase CsaB [Oscillospiraceae bacterium]|jgi:polysaccharide pyruvyl transferase CsaB|nr:polysaccharide pyruvyl transferase CsaB [Oscillospiraceae bacterium]
MKALHLIGGGDAGGAKTHVIGLLAGLKDTTLVSFREGDFAREAREAGLDVRVMPGSLRATLRTLKVLAEGYDLIHCHGARGNFIGVLLKHAVKKPVVTTVHSDYRLDYMGRPCAFLTYGVINRFALRFLDAYIGVSDVMAETLIRRGFRPEKVYTIYNGLEFSEPEEPVNKAALAETLGVPYREGDVFAGIAARFDPVKDLPTLIRAAASLKGSCPRLRFLIAGDGKQGPALRKLVKKLDAPVTFLGWLDDTGDLFRLLDINLLTSRFETFSYVLTEGARKGCATVASDVGGAPLLIDHGVNGFLFPFRDATKLAGFIKTLYDDPGLRASMGKKLRNKVKANFSMEATVKTQEGIYRSLLSSRSGERGVTICGAYGMNNTGDDAILEAILREIRQTDPDIAVRILSRSPPMTRRVFRECCHYSFNLLALLRANKKSRIFLCGGGNLIQDITSRRSLWFYLFAIWLAKWQGCRVVMLGCGIGPVLTPFNRRLTARVLNRHVEIITLREEISKKELEQLGVTGPKILLSADPALILSPEEPDKVDSVLIRQGVPLEGQYIGIALRDWQGLDQKLPDIAAAIEYAYETYGLTAVFIPVERTRDVRSGEKAAALVRCPCHVLRETGSARLTIGLLSRMRMVIAMRLHALIFSSGQGVPMVGLPYTDKVSAFMDYMGQPLYTPLEVLTAERLIGHIDRAMELPPRIDAVERLREREKVNRDVLTEILL